MASNTTRNHESLPEPDRIAISFYENTLSSGHIIRNVEGTVMVMVPGYDDKIALFFDDNVNSALLELLSEITISDWEKIVERNK